MVLGRSVRGRYETIWRRISVGMVLAAMIPETLVVKMVMRVFDVDEKRGREWKAG